MTAVTQQNRIQSRKIKPVSKCSTNNLVVPNTSNRKGEER
jgi:hypothetical protein